ncbi:MAG: glycerol-3-phosphate responsive antiterminator [Clostridiales bacterium]|nr:glycerol-3-phosphate responsive antiterminator [Clostridiales bacterium]
MDQRFYDAVLASPVIAAVKDMEQLEECLTLDSIQVVFLLFGDLCSIADIVARAKDGGKIVMIHTDLVGGLSSGKEIAVDFIHQNTRADGIISTKPNLVRRARELKMFTVLRLFVIDSMALAGIDKLEGVKPDFIEVLPGVMPKTIRRIAQTTRIPILAGGLIKDKEDVMAALSAGAMAVSATSRDVWRM